MNREIKFRGRRRSSRKNYQKWVYGNLYNDKKDCFIMHRLENGDIEVENCKKETIGQFTGLYDKNGKEIYEGDKVNITYKEITVENAIIEYRGSSFYGSTLSDMWELDMYFSIEVIGNIYEVE